MDAGSAMGQTVEDAFPYWAFFLAAAILGIATLGFILKNIAVSAGHAIMVGGTVALLLFPYVKSFKWGEGKIEFESRLQTLAVSQAIEKVVVDQQKQNDALRKLTSELSVAAQNIEALRSGGMTSSGPITQLPEVNPESLKNLQDQVKTLSLDTQNSLGNIQEIQRDIRIPRF